MAMEPESNLNSKNVEVERQRSSLYFVTRGVLGDRYALLGTFMLLVFVICAVFAPWIAPYGPNDADPFLRLKGIGTEGHILGLDGHGRDMLSRLIYGARMSMVTGFGPVLIGALVAIPLGTIAAYYDKIG